MNRQLTGQGYAYYRDRAGGSDVTVYEHQLLALADHGASEVFDPETDVHHHAPAPDANVPNGVAGVQWLSVVESETHRAAGGDRYRVVA